MSETRDDGGPAFPTDDRMCPSRHYYGMSLRDYFAGQVLPRAAGTNGAELAARMSYEYADAMLKERAK